MAPSTNTHRSRQTRYRAIERYLRSLVEGAGPGDPLPSEAELCEQFSVSRMTVRQALSELTNDGLVERRRGQGTFVAHRPVHRRPGVFLSFTEEMNRRGVQATSRLLGAGMDDARRSETLDLGLAPGDEVVHRQWGRGTVAAISGQGERAMAEVDFPGLGRKRLLLRYAPLTRP